MQLFVIRHAVAEDVGPGIDDTARELTETGKAKLRQAVRGLRALEIRFERILTSPWKRAVQTARQLEPIAASPPVATDLLIQPPRAELLALIAERAETTAVVGHEPRHQARRRADHQEVRRAVAGGHRRPRRHAGARRHPAPAAARDPLSHRRPAARLPRAASSPLLPIARSPRHNCMIACIFIQQ
jgi:hypothetical protein